MTWTPFNSTDQIAPILERSHQLPCLIFKHSTSCSISSIAKHRLEGNGQFSPGEIAAYYLDLLAFRPVSNAVSTAFEVYHESPQIILLWRGEVVLDASHLDISVVEIKEVLESLTAPNS